MLSILLFVAAVIILAPAILVALVVYSIKYARRVQSRPPRDRQGVIEGEVLNVKDEPKGK